MKVLIIEDDIISARLLAEFLKPQFDVVMAHTANDAIAIAKSDEPNLIISDWDLKDDLDGVQVCKIITEHLQAPIIFVSGSPLDQLIKLSEDLRPLHVLTKPINLDNVSLLIGEWQESLS